MHRLGTDLVFERTELSCFLLSQGLFPVKALMGALMGVYVQEFEILDFLKECPGVVTALEMDDGYCVNGPPVLFMELLEDEDLHVRNLNSSTVSTPSSSLCRRHVKSLQTRTHRLVCTLWRTPVAGANLELPLVRRNLRGVEGLLCTAAGS
jgi:hypothetical protein